MPTAPKVNVGGEVGLRSHVCQCQHSRRHIILALRVHTAEVPGTSTCNVIGLLQHARWPLARSFCLHSGTDLTSRPVSVMVGPRDVEPLAQSHKIRFMARNRYCVCNHLAARSQDNTGYWLLSCTAFTCIVYDCVTAFAAKTLLFGACARKNINTMVHPQTFRLRNHARPSPGVQDT
jgi:hypothetical protein